MLESFIQSNGLRAKILPCIANGSLIKCRLFSCNSFDLLAVFFARDRIDEKKLLAAVSVESLLPAGNIEKQWLFLPRKPGGLFGSLGKTALQSIAPVEAEEAEETTGYKAGFLPPVSIYGVRVVVDSKVMNAKSVKCLLKNEKTLEISPSEIVSANDGAIVAGITI